MRTTARFHIQSKTVWSTIFIGVYFGLLCVTRHLDSFHPSSSQNQREEQDWKQNRNGRRKRNLHKTITSLVIIWNHPCVFSENQRIYRNRNILTSKSDFNCESPADRKHLILLLKMRLMRLMFMWETFFSVLTSKETYDRFLCTSQCVVNFKDIIMKWCKFQTTTFTSLKKDQDTQDV